MMDVLPMRRPRLSTTGAEAGSVVSGGATAASQCAFCHELAVLETQRLDTERRSRYRYQPLPLQPQANPQALPNVMESPDASF